MGMRAVVLDVPEHWLEERARLGQDRWDEMWEGVLHVVPPPRYQHQAIGTELVGFLVRIVGRRGIQVRYETGVFRRTDDYRIPDLAFLREDEPGSHSERGIEKAPLAVLEILSPGDETYEKFPFWAGLGVPEVIVVGPGARSVEVHRLVDDRYERVETDEAGRVHATAIDVRFATDPGPPPRLRVEADGASTAI